jgi:hypothetical protein
MYLIFLNLNFQNNQISSGGVIRVFVLRGSVYQDAIFWNHVDFCPRLFITQKFEIFAISTFETFFNFFFFSPAGLEPQTFDYAYSYPYITYIR